MRLFEFTKAKKTLIEPTDGLWFRHESPDHITTLRPMTYDELRVIRPGYPVDDRKDREDDYRKLTFQKPNTSFLYATVVGSNCMDEPDAYPGFTYYFQLTAKQISQCVFDVVDKELWMQPTSGHRGLIRAMAIWRKHSIEFVSFDEPDIGEILPRIEVIIPFSITPTLFYPQEEDRM